MDPILQINNLSVKFDTGIQRINAIDNMSLHINRGEILGIIGASGSGKSTLGKCILGLVDKHQSTVGEILYSRTDVTIDLLSQSEEEWRLFRKDHCTIVFQNPLLNLNPASTIATHFERILSLKNKTEGSKLILELLQKVELDEYASAILEAYPHQLSGGQQQRVLIALALCQGVDLLVLDEPMSSLDRRNQDSISRILKQLVEKEELTIVLISHDLNVIERLSHRICVLNHGKLVEEGKTVEILNNPQKVYTQSLVEAKLLGVNRSEKGRLEPLITIRDLNHQYKKGGFLGWTKSKVDALKNVKLIIDKGSVTGIVGVSGSGKTTLVKLLIGALDVQDGEILWGGDNTSSLSPQHLQTKVQLISQNANDAFNPRMLIDDQLNEVYRRHLGQADNYDKVISSLINDVDLIDDMRYRYPSELSGGEIQRFAIVRALIVRPEVLILDESLSALDMIVQKKLVNLIAELNAKLNMTIIMISHDDRVISKCCDRIVALAQGEVLLV